MNGFKDRGIGHLHEGSYDASKASKFEQYAKLTLIILSIIGILAGGFSGLIYLTVDPLLSDIKITVGANARAIQRLEKDIAKANANLEKIESHILRLQVRPARIPQ